MAYEERKDGAEKWREETRDKRMEMDYQLQIELVRKRSQNYCQMRLTAVNLHQITWLYHVVVANPRSK
jgi:hypothetical protein